MFKILNKTFIFFIIFLFFSNLYSNENLIEKLKDGEKIILISHALAPGSGDPIKFDLSDCSTQRNLNTEGIEQC